MSADLPDEVVRAIERWVDSLDSLEVLLLLQRSNGRPSTPAEVAASLGISEKAAARELAKLVGRGLAAQAGDGFQLAALVPPIAAEVAAIAAAYRERRVDLINHVASGALRRIRDLADAFRIGKAKKEE